MTQMQWYFIIKPEMNHIPILYHFWYAKVEY